jgi:hypothetical protein
LFLGLNNLCVFFGGSVEPWVGKKNADEGCYVEETRGGWDGKGVYKYQTRMRQKKG